MSQDNSDVKGGEDPEERNEGLIVPEGAGETVKPNIAQATVDTQLDYGISPAVTTVSSDDRGAKVTTAPEISTFKDHFTLSIPTSTIRYRDSRSAARVISSEDNQFVLEELYDASTNTRRTEIRQIPDTSEGVRFLRFSYLVVTAFWTGFLFIFCLQILLYLALDLAIQLGVTSKDGENTGRAIGTVLGFPPLVYGLASAMVLAGEFIIDTWRGHPLISNFALRSFGPVAVEWIFFSFFLGIPLFILCCSLLSGSEEWWQITILTWFSCVAFFYALFTINVVAYEINTCWLIMINHYKFGERSKLKFLRRCIQLRQLHTFSGYRTRSYLCQGTIEDTEYTDKSCRVNRIDTTEREYISYFTRFTLWDKISKEKGIGLYKHLKEEEEERLHSIEDARDVRPFMTTHTWSLEKVFCRPRDSRYIAIVNGPGALTVAQMQSSFICSIIGVFLIFFIIFSVLIYVEVGFTGTLFGIAIAVICMYPGLQSSYNLYKTARDLPGLILNKNDPKPSEESTTDAVSTESEGVYLYKETFRIAKPTYNFCWAIFTLEFSVFFIYPLVSLFGSGNWPLGVMFILFVGITKIRYYVNAAIVLENAGHMNLVGGNSEYSRWKKQSRLNEIVGNITRGRSIGAWMGVFGVVGFTFLSIMLGAVGTSSEQYSTVPPKTFAFDFYYEQMHSLRYPTCHLTNDLGASPLTTMTDYAFLAGLAYSSIDNTQTELDEWFGEGVAVDEKDIVEEFRQRQNTSSAVSFKLVTMQPRNVDTRRFAYVLIRGTTNAWDMLTDAQLWSAAALMQVHRELLPVGAMWTPIIDYLIKVLNAIESEAINKVSFYKDTGAFVKFLKNQTDTYSGIAVTGHSLGGGLSIITGAQLGVPAVAVSGPNAMLSRKSFDPPIRKEQLNAHTFNIIPFRDIVPMIDDRAQNYQQIRCQASFADVIGCHSIARSLCEILYTCGTVSSDPRPIPCNCVYEFGFPEPKAAYGVNITFAEACVNYTSE